MTQKTKLISFFLCMLLTITSFSFLSCDKKEERPKPKIVCTTFVLADWTRQVLGDDAENFTIELLGANGADIHSYQPTVRDITLLSKCDIFIHIGGESDAWASDTLASAANKSMIRLDIAEALGEKLCGEPHSHEGHSHGEGEAHFDEHIWFSFAHAKSAVREISHTLAEFSPDKKDLYETNANSYTERISSLESDYSAAAETAVCREVVVADRYPFAYLFDFMNIHAHAAFEGCSAESEASFEVMAKLIQAVDENSLSYILVCENSGTDIAEAVKNNAKTKVSEILTLNSLQSLGSTELERGVSYISVMEENLSVIIKATSK